MSLNEQLLVLESASVASFHDRDRPHFVKMESDGALDKNVNVPFLQLLVNLIGQGYNSKFERIGVDKVNRIGFAVVMTFTTLSAVLCNYRFVGYIRCLLHRGQIIQAIAFIILSSSLVLLYMVVHPISLRQIHIVMSQPSWLLPIHKASPWFESNAYLCRRYVQVGTVVYLAVVICAYVTVNMSSTFSPDNDAMLCPFSLPEVLNIIDMMGGIIGSYVICVSVYLLGAMIMSHAHSFQIIISRLRGNGEHYSSTEEFLAEFFEVRRATLLTASRFQTYCTVLVTLITTLTVEFLITPWLLPSGNGGILIPFEMWGLYNAIVLSLLLV